MAKQDVDWAQALPVIERELDKLVTYGVRRNIMEELHADLIAPRLEGTPEVGKSEDEEFEIWVRFGRRDWQFNSKTGKLLGAGTFLG